MRNNVRRSLFSAIFMTTILWLGLAASAQAHGGLRSAFPVPNEPVVNPTEVRLGFPEELAGGISIQVVSWESFKEVQLGPAQIDPAQPTVAFVPLAPLEPGRYSVNWYVEMADGSSAEGSYEFDVVLSLPLPGGQPIPTTSGAPPAADIAPSPPAASAPANAPLLNSRMGLVTALGVTVVLLVALLLLFMRPGRR